MLTMPKDFRSTTNNNCWFSKSWKGLQSYLSIHIQTQVLYKGANLVVWVHTLHTSVQMQPLDPTTSHVLKLEAQLVTSGVDTHHFLLCQCQRGRTIAAHLVSVFFFGADSCWMTDEAVSSCFPLMFGLWIIPQLSVVVLVGFCSNLMCFCHTAMKDSLLGLAQCWSWVTGTP